MADEFIDFYKALGLPFDADRKQVRSRINEAYTEAQRNLDHRVFATRVGHQKMFEVILPRARYILLDDSRRDDYDQMVRAFRGASPVAKREKVSRKMWAPMCVRRSSNSPELSPSSIGTRSCSITSPASNFAAIHCVVTPVSLSPSHSAY